MGKKKKSLKKKKSYTGREIVAKFISARKKKVKKKASKLSTAATTSSTSSTSRTYNYSLEGKSRKKKVTPKGSINGISVTLILSQKHINKLKKLVKSGSYASRSEAVRYAIDLLMV